MKYTQDVDVCSSFHPYVMLVPDIDIMILLLCLIGGKDETYNFLCSLYPITLKLQRNQNSHCKT